LHIDSTCNSEASYIFILYFKYLQFETSDTESSSDDKGDDLDFSTLMDQGEDEAAATAAAANQRVDQVFFFQKWKPKFK